MEREEQGFYGKYRGVVSDNEDPDKRGRIRAIVPDIFGEEQSGWALPCLPYAGKDVGFLALPPLKALVWIEFEAGDPEYPIWSGCFWHEQEQAPVDSYSPEIKIFKTGAGTIILNEASGKRGIMIESAKMKIVINEQGILIDNGKGATIKLDNKQVVINGGALEVT